MATGIIKGVVTHTNSMKYNVNILSYDENNSYTAPCDGYVIAESSRSSNGGAIVIANRTLTHTVAPGAYATVFIQKGLHVFGENLVTMIFRAFSEVGGGNT